MEMNADMKFVIMYDFTPLICWYRSESRHPVIKKALIPPYTEESGLIIHS